MRFRFRRLMALGGLLCMTLTGSDPLAPLAVPVSAAALVAASEQLVADPVNSYVFAAPQVVPAGGTAVVTLVARDASGAVVPGQSVTFAVTSGTATLAPGAATTGPSGDVSVQVTRSGVGQVTVRGYLGATTGDPTPTRGEVTLTFAAAPLAPTNIGAVGTSGQVALTWTPADAQGMPVSDHRVQYRVAGTSVWTTFEPAGSWAQQGATFLGTSDRFEFGHRVASSADGQVVAMTDHTQAGSFLQPKVPLINVFAWNITTGAWEPRGAPFSPEQAGETLTPGKTVTLSLSADGRVLAAGIEGDSMVRVWVWDGTSWIRRGADLHGDASRRFGNQVVLSADGSRMAVGENVWRGPLGFNQGRVSVFEWSGSTWTPLGQAIGGASANAYAGHVALSHSGQVLAIGQPSYNAPGTYDVGLLRVYVWNGTTLLWEQRGSDFLGTFNYHYFGISPSLSASGDVLAFSTHADDGSISGAGEIRVYDWFEGAWVQRGASIFGGSDYELLGAPKLSADGMRLFASAESYEGLGPPYMGTQGYARAFAWNGTAWVPRGQTLYGSQRNEYFGEGEAVSVSGDLRQVTIGVSQYEFPDDIDAPGIGRAVVYQWSGGIGPASVTVPGLVNGTSYEFRVAALNVLGQSTYSTPVTAAPYPPATQLTLTDASSVVAGQRMAYVVTRRDGLGNLTSPGTTQTVYLTSTGTGGAFYTAASGGTPVTSVTIAAGQSAATVYFQATTASDYTVTVSDATPADGATGLADASDTLTVTPGAPTQLTLTDAATVVAGARAAYTVTRRDGLGNLTSPGTTQTVYLTATGTGGAFYTAASGGTPVTSVTIAAGQSAATVYFQATTAGDFTVTVSDATPADGATGLADASDTLTVTPGMPTQLTLTDAATVVAGARAAYTVTRRDGLGNLTSPGTTQTVYLTATGAGGAFYTAASGGTPVTSVTIAAGQSAATVYFTSDDPGVATLTASDATPADGPTGLADAGDALTVAVDPSSLAIIAAYDGTTTVPTAVTYRRAGVTGVSDAVVLNAVNSAVARLAGSVTDATAEVQQVVAAYLRILAEANGSAADATSLDPTTTDYASIGASTASGLSASGLALLNDVIGDATIDAIDTVSAIEALATSVSRVMTVAAGGSPSPAFSLDDLLRLGISGIDATQLPFVITALASTRDDGADVMTVTALRAVVSAVAANGLRLTGPASGRVGEAVTLTLQVVDTQGRPSVLTGPVSVALTATVAGTTFEPGDILTLAAGTRDITVRVRTPASGPQRIDAAWLQPGGVQRDPARTVGQWSLTVAKQSQSISFSAIDPQGLGTQHIALVASASSGLPIAFSAQTPGVCSVSSGRVSVLAVGVCTVQASQVGNDTYEASAVVDRSFTVTRAQIEFVPGNVTVDAQGGDRLVMAAVSPANTAWQAASSAPWVTTSSAGTGNGEVALRIAPNPLPTARTATITMDGSSFAVTQAPRLIIELRTADIVGELITVQWRALGGVPNGYVVSLGTTPGARDFQYAAGRAEVLTFQAPPSRFYLRVYAAADTTFSEPSNELPVLVQQPQAPSAPVNFTAGVSGTAVSLAWTPTFDGGEPEQIWLEVNDGTLGVLPLGRQGHIQFEGVPAGVYRLRLWAQNGSGRSALTAPVTVEVPARCVSAPAVPQWLAAGVAGRRVTVLWEYGGGSAPSDYLVTASGIGSGTTGGMRRVSGDLGPGTYDITVQAVNACGTSAPATTYFIVVP